MPFSMFLLYYLDASDAWSYHALMFGGSPAFPLFAMIPVDRVPVLGTE
jgi:hypothetical protein